VNSAVMFSKASDEWGTPKEFFDTLDAEFDFNTDAACTPLNGLCAYQIYNALEEDWSDDGDYDIVRVFLNPPYSKCREFIAKAALEASKGCTVVCLVPSRTDTRWWHEHVWDREQHRPKVGVEVRFIKGRLRFSGAAAGAPFPSVVVVFRPLGAA
jgi:phage N-6-adenine-methyltransferase